MPRLGSTRAGPGKEDRCQRDPQGVHRPHRSGPAARGRICAGSRMAQRRRDADLPAFLHLDQAASGPRSRGPDVPRRHPGRRESGRWPRARLGNAHLRTLTVMGFPSATYPGILDDLNRLAFPYRWSTRAVALDKTDATRVLTRIRRQWFAKRKSIMAILKEVMTNEASALPRHGRPQQGAGRRCGPPGARLRPGRAGLRHRHRHGLGPGSKRR